MLVAGRAPLTTGAVRRALLRWYDTHKRDLPWRGTTDPYAVWVSEVMLQQTRVETVIPYYERFLSRFPTLASLAEADEDEVLAHFSGLGYYRRARTLHAGVREVVERYGGEVPRARDARRALPGVGRYTAGAIGSIAFGKREAVVDGNVMRVLSRLYAIDTPLGRAATERDLWARAEALVEGPRPGDLNQSLMELGARVCVPRDARCSACPARRWCAAHRTDRVAELPVPKPKRTPEDVRCVAVVATCRGAVALSKSEGSLFSGLFGLPMTQGAGRSVARRALEEAGVSARLEPHPAGRLEHVLSHRRLLVEVWRASAARSGVARLVPRGEIARLGTSTLTRKCLARASQ